VSFLSPSLWYRFGDRLFYMVHQPLLFFVLLGICTVVKRRRDPAFAGPAAFLFVVAGLNLFVRWFIFFLGHAFNTRYFMLEGVAAVILTGLGMASFEAWLRERLDQRQVKRAAILALCVTVGLLLAVTLPKTLKVRNDKVWVRNMAEEIVRRGLVNPLIWMERPDNRLAYFCKGRLAPPTPDVRLEDFHGVRDAAGGCDILFVSRREPDEVAADFAQQGLPARVELLHREPYKRGFCSLFKVVCATGESQAPASPSPAPDT